MKPCELRSDARGLDRALITEALAAHMGEVSPCMAPMQHVGLLDLVATGGAATHASLASGAIVGLGSQEPVHVAELEHEAAAVALPLALDGLIVQVIQDPGAGGCHLGISIARRKAGIEQ